MTDIAHQQALSPDLIPFISKPDVSMAVASVEDANWTPQMEEGLEMETARVNFQVVSPIHGSLRDGQIISLPAKRVADPIIRVRHGFDAWNSLSLTPGERVILAVRPATLQPGWIGVAAQDISGDNAAEVESVRRAYVIEEAPGGLPEKDAMLDSALKSGQQLLVSYALDYLRRHAFQRQSAVQILSGAMSSTPPSDQKLDIGRALIGGDFFRRQAKADPPNCLVVAALATALVQETEGSRRAYWVQLLRSCVLMDFTGDESDNRKIRLEFTRSPGAPPVNKVEAALSASESFVPADTQGSLGELKRLWETP